MIGYSSVDDFATRLRQSQQWQSKRSRLNHDWLKNNYLPAIHRTLNWARGDVEAPDLTPEATASMAAKFLDTLVSIEQLIEHMPFDMSPSTLIQKTGFEDRVCDELHEKWLKEFDILDKSNRCREALDVARQAHMKLYSLSCSIAACDNGRFSGGHLLTSVSEAAASAAHLAKAIEALPCKLLIPVD